jgi:hypothetical protein
LASRYFGDNASKAAEWLWWLALAALEDSNILRDGVVPAKEAAARLRDAR